MNFICDKCKQKYHVADEKLQGRAVTRFRCKKCDHIIELEAPTQTALGSSSGAASHAVVRPASQPMPAARNVPSGPTAAPKPRPSTTTGPAFGAPGSGANTPARAATLATPAARAAAGRPDPSRANNQEKGWYAGIRDVPVGPLSRKELGARVASGDITPDTLVWREGLDDWRALQAVAELADLLKPAAAPAAAAPATATTSATPATTSTSPADAARAAATARVGRSAVDDDDEEATRVAGLDPSLAGIMGKSGKAATRPPEERPRPGAPMLSPLARPAPARTNAERSDASPLPTKPATASTDPSSANTRPTSESPPERSSSPPRDATPQKRPEDELLDDLFARPANRANPSPRPEHSPLLSSSPSSPGLQAAKAPATPPPPATPSSPAAPSATATISAGLPLSSTPPGGDLLPRDATPKDATAKDNVDLAPPVVSSPAPVVTPSSPAKPAVLDLPQTPSSVLQPPPVPTATATPATGSRGIPPIAWVMMLGVLVAGVLGGLFIGRMSPNTPHPQPTPQPVAVRDAGARDVAVAAPDADAASPSAPQGLAPGAPPTQQTAMALTSSAARVSALLRAFQESHVADTCWRATLAQAPTLQPTSVTVDLGVDAAGRVTTVSVGGSPDVRFDACVRAHLGDVASIGAGEALDTRTSVTLGAQ